MRNLIKTFGFNTFAFCALFALATAGLFATPASAQIGFSINIGAPPPPVPEVVVAAPFAGAAWVPGYYAVEFGHYRWIPGAWQHPPYEGARWIAPRYDGGHFTSGRWDRGGAVASHFRGDQGFHNGFARGGHADRDQGRGDRDSHGRR